MTLTDVSRRRLLRRLYATYGRDSAFAHMLPHTGGVVPGTGPTNPALVFIGEAPGRTEDKQREPFVGASGRFLNELLASVGLRREEVFITNSVKIRPTEVVVIKTSRSEKYQVSNRPPTEAEKDASIPYLRAEMGHLGNPPIVVLGKHAKGAAARLPRDMPLNDGDMKVGEWTFALGVPLLPLHHPAYGLYQQQNQPLMFEQFKQVRRFL